MLPDPIESKKDMAIKIAVTGLKWFVGRQERGRVQSSFTVWIFQLMIRNIEQLIEAKVVFDFDTADAHFASMFEAGNPGRVINREGRVLQ
jgi:hypothetical protein